MVNRAYLRPHSVENRPPQGDFRYSPVFVLFEDTTMAGLQAQLLAEFGTTVQDPDSLWVIENTEYQIAVTRFGTNNQEPELVYSVMVWATRAEKV